MHMLKIGDPCIANSFCNKLRQRRIAIQKPSSLSHSVCHIEEFIWIHLIKILKDRIFKDLRMQSSNTINFPTAIDGQMGHLNLSIFNDGHPSQSLFVIWILFSDGITKIKIQLLNDMVLPWK